MIHKKRKHCRKCPVCHQYIECIDKRGRLEFKIHKTKHGGFCKQVEAGKNKQ